MTDAKRIGADRCLATARGIILCTVLVGATTAWADPPALQGPTFLPGDGVSDAAAGNQEEVAIAAGGGGFLTAWTDMRTSTSWSQGLEQSGRDVYAARLDAVGNLVDTTPLILSQAEGFQENPEIAWNGQNWLVIWDHETSTGPSTPPKRKIFGTRVAPDGTVLDTPFEILETPGYAAQMVGMAVAANGPEWLVVGRSDSNATLVGARVAADGTVLDPAPEVLIPDTYDASPPFRIHVAQGEYLLVYKGAWIGADWIFEARRFASDLRPIGGPIDLTDGWPRVGSNGSEYFIAWDPPGLSLLGSRMSLDGTLIDPAGIPLMESDWDTILHTRVEWDGTNWWILHLLPYADGGLHVARVSPAGVVIDSPPIHAFDPADEEFVGPFELEGNPAGGAQLVWADQDCGCPNEWDPGLQPYDVHGRNISATGQVNGESALSCGLPAQTQPDLAAGPDQLLAVFQSEAGDVKRIVAQRLDNQGNAIDAEPIEIAASPYVENPAVAWNGSLYTIVWDEFYYCIGGDPPPCGPFIQAARMLPDGTVIDTEPITVLQANHADVAALDNNFLVVGRNNSSYAHVSTAVAMRMDGVTGALLDPAPIGVGGSFAVYPQVTTFNDKWLVVFERRASHDESWGGSYFNFVATDGTVQFDPWFGHGACNGGKPGVAVSGANALVVCREKAFGHFLADVNGGLIGPDEDSTLLAISTAVEEQRNPAVTWTGTEYLVAWEDKRNAIDYFDNRTDLYGARVDLLGNVLDPDGFAISTGSVPVQHPALVWSGADVLLATARFRETDTNFRLAVYHADGTINDPPTVSFSESTTGGCSPLAVSFTDESVGDVSSWYWSFGDGEVSFDQNPTHVYVEPGTYTVYLIAGGASGPASHVKSDLVTVTQGTVADFSASVTAGCAPLDVSFVNTSLGDQTGWVWMFGDDSVSTEQHPTHTYQYPGNYTVMMTADGACGADTAIRFEYIQIDRMCPIQDGAVADQAVEGVVTGTYLDTHIDADPNNYQSVQEVSAPAPGGGTTWQLEHRWRFDVTGGSDGVDFFVDFYVFWEPEEGFVFEYSQDNVNWTPLLTITSPWSSQHRVPLPPDLTGTLWIRMYDTDRTAGDTYQDWTAVYGMAIETGVPTPNHPVPATTGLEFVDAASMQWMPTASATHYDVMWGTLEELRANGTVGDAQCGWDDSAGTSLVDLTDPPPGVGYYYIIRGDAAELQAGTLDNVPGMTVPEGRDQEVGTAGGYSCGDMP